MTITDGKDPDEFIKARGPEMFRVLIEGAKPLIAYRIDEIKQNYDLEDTEQLLEFTEAAAKVLAEIRNPVEQELYSKQVAKDAGISVDSLRTQVSILLRKQRQTEERQEERRERKSYEERTGGRRDLRQMGLRNAERLLLNFMSDSRVLKKVKDAGIVPEDFGEGLHRELARQLFQAGAEGRIDINALLEQFPPEEVGAVAAILLDDKNTEHKNQACEQPLAIMLEAKRRSVQDALLEQGDLNELDKILKMKKKNQDNRNGENKQSG